MLTVQYYLTNYNNGDVAHVSMASNILFRVPPEEMLKQFHEPKAMHLLFHPHNPDENVAYLTNMSMNNYEPNMTNHQSITREYLKEELAEMPDDKDDKDEYWPGHELLVAYFNSHPEIPDNESVLYDIFTCDSSFDNQNKCQLKIIDPKRTSVSTTQLPINYLANCYKFAKLAEYADLAKNQLRSNQPFNIPFDTSVFSLETITQSELTAIQTTISGLMQDKWIEIALTYHNTDNQRMISNSVQPYVSPVPGGVYCLNVISGYVQIFIPDDKDPKKARVVTVEEIIGWKHKFHMEFKTRDSYDDEIDYP
jgi:hypothetical protein